MEPQYTGDKIIECPKSFSKSQPKRLPACGSCKQLEKRLHALEQQFAQIADDLEHLSELEDSGQ